MKTTPSINHHDMLIFTFEATWTTAGLGGSLSAVAVPDTPVDDDPGGVNFGIVELPPWEVGMVKPAET